MPAPSSSIHSFPSWLLPPPSFSTTPLTLHHRNRRHCASLLHHRHRGPSSFSTIFARSSLHGFAKLSASLLPLRDLLSLRCFFLYRLIDLTLCCIFLRHRHCRASLCITDLPLFHHPMLLIPTNIFLPFSPLAQALPQDFRAILSGYFVMDLEGLLPATGGNTKPIRGYPTLPATERVESGAGWLADLKDFQPDETWSQLKVIGLSRSFLNDILSTPQAGFGYVLRDSLGNSVLGCSGHLPVWTVFRCELLADWNGLMLAWEVGCKNVICETDSFEVFQHLQNTLLRDVDLSHKIQDLLR
ncbi:hypothetical protein PIB30_054219 [Stylosanthes scabra]|uniref:RNase H type-1 domain-containing protein n=1 Tax=Stylosanthes scabra TaxID=79078 RepID=A0ABU6UHH6_9FABA|nr:hypothetical protein [Stylosanthes scabra]